MSDVQRFSYFAIHPELGEVGFRPQITFALSNGEKRLPMVEALLDSGSTVNVLPFSFGLTLGAEWERQTQRVQLTGNLANYEARGLILEATVGTLAPVELIFAWTRRDHIPVILGQFNFFIEFDVCFFRTQRIIEIRPKSSR